MLAARTRTTLAAAILFAAALLAVAPARAADTGLPPDIVRTKDGGMMRGTIIESVPAERVEILLLNGQSRTIPMSDVVYAGPASADPGAAPPIAPPPGQPPKAARGQTTRSPTLHIELTGDPDGLTFHRKLGTSRGYAGGLMGTEIETTHLQPLCSVPCAVELPPGTYQLGLSPQGSRVLDTFTEFELRRDVRLHGRVESRAGLRLTGWMIIASAVVLGAIVAVYDRQRDCITANICDDRYPYALPGLGIIVLGTGIGGYMALQPNRAEIDIR